MEVPDPHPDLATYKFREYLRPGANRVGAKAEAECLMCRTGLDVHRITELGSFMLCNKHWTEYWFLHEYPKPEEK